MEYKVISGDSHVDIVWLPEDLFVSGAPARLKDRMPKVIETREGRVWVADGTRLNQSQGGNYILERWQRHGRCKHQCVGSGL